CYLDISEDCKKREEDAEDDMQFGQSLMIETIPSYISDLSSHHRRYISSLESCKGMSQEDINNSFILSSLEVMMVYGHNHNIVQQLKQYHSNRRIAFKYYEKILELNGKKVGLQCCS